MTAQPYQVGDVFGPLVKPPITKTQLVMYSGASGDFNPIHTVEEYAIEVGLGGVIAHGMLSMAFIGQLLTDTIGPEGVLQQFTIRFVDMVRPGDQVMCEGTVTACHEEGDWAVVISDVFAKVQERRVLTGCARFKVPIRN